ncbi:MAG: helix-turn-helix transcriptional regulator [Oscillospiraceae bacterium]|nr:helix-turn-helix transcriptional regulator [Oscillospiraceae bacterium]
MDFGKKLSELRKQNGISQEKLAEMVGVSRQAVTKWESGKSNPDTENLIRLAEIFGISLDELCLGEIPKKPEAKIHIGGHILALLSILIVAAYCVIGGITGDFNGEILVLLIILAIPMHCFTHLIFWGMVKSGEFSMLAGYDSSIKYDTENMKRYVAGIDFMTGFETVSYLFIISATALIVPEMEIYGILLVGYIISYVAGIDFMTGFETVSYLFIISATALIVPEMELYGILLVGYIISYVAGILFIGYKYGDKIYCDPKDAKAAKRGLPSSVVLIVLMLASVFWFMLLFELKGYENNTLTPFPMLGMMFVSIGFALAGYLFENKRLKKADEHAPLFGKHFIVLNLLALCAMVLMAFI